MSADWYADAACRGYPAKWFFPSPKRKTMVPEVFCARCTVREDCRAQAIANGEQHGIWGGLPALDRAETKPARRHQRRAERRAS